MESKKCSKIKDIVRLQQVLKKWRKQATCNTHDHKQDTIIKETKKITNNKSIKKTLTFSYTRASLQILNTSSEHHVPKGYLAVCVGKNNELDDDDDDEIKRFVIPMHYLKHGLFIMLLRDAEEEFGFQNEGVLRIPCKVEMFEKVLKMMGREMDDEDSLVGSCSWKTE